MVDLLKKSQDISDTLSEIEMKDLVKETIDDIPFYYAGFRDVLNKTKTFEEIMADSGLQTDIKAYIFGLLLRFLDHTKYKVYMGEVGSHLNHRSNMGLDVVVYEKSILTPDKITSRYIDVVPKIVVEIDVRVEARDEDNVHIFEDFVLRKVRNLHKFGTEKIIWIFTKSKTVIVATADQKWDVLDWDVEVEILDGVSFNIASYLQSEGINPDL